MCDRVCSHCDKEFKTVYNCERHIKTCKKNLTPKKENTESMEKILLDTTEQLLREQIEMLKEQLKIKDEQINNLIEKINNSSSNSNKQYIQPCQKPRKELKEFPQEELKLNLPETEIKENNKEEVKEISPVIKMKISPVENYIKNNCNEAYTLNELISEVNEVFTVEDYQKISLSKYEKKYLTIIKKAFENIPKNKYPIQVIKNKKGAEEGYIKTENGFEKHYGNELIEKINFFIQGKKGYCDGGLQQVLLNINLEYSYTQHYKSLDIETRTEVYMSLLGCEDNDENKNLEHKKNTALIKSILDLCMVSL
jgi:hypothetical protein